MDMETQNLLLENLKLQARRQDIMERDMVTLRAKLARLEARMDEDGVPERTEP